MGEDANYPADNDTVISSEWRLSDRTGLNAAIAEAEKKLGDSSRYTDETVDVLRRELEAAAGLAGDALQAEVNLAGKGLSPRLRGSLRSPGITAAFQTATAAQAARRMTAGPAAVSRISMRRRPAKASHGPLWR